MITFDPVRHQYKNDFTGELYTSVTTLLGKYKKPFDSVTAAERVAKREGKTVETVLAEWKTLNTASQEYGTLIHSIIEDYNKEQKIRKGYEDLITSYNALGILDVWNDTLYSEKLLHLHSYKLAGTADIIRDEGKGGFSIFDIKTNKKFNFFSQYNERLLSPLDHLTACEFTSYSLQLSLYALMYQNLTGRHLNQLGIFYYDRESLSFKYYPVVYMRTDVINLLTHYAKS